MVTNLSTVAIEMDRLKDIHCGLGQVCLHLGRAFLDLAPADLDLKFLLYPGNEKWFAGKLRPTQLKRLHKVYRPLPWLAPRADLWHALHQDTRYWPPRRSTPFILTINDLNFLREGETSRERIKRRLRQLQKLVDRAQLITCISQFTAREVREHLKLEGKRVEVVYLGAHLPELTGNQLTERPHFLPTAPYLFSVGTILPKKNFHVVVEMMAHLKHLHWVCAGSTFGDYATLIRELAHKHGVEKRIHLPGTITEEQKYQALYHCQGLVHPSLAEGFGIPPIEAMNFGRPVFLSTYCSLPEVGGTEANYFTSFEAQAMAGIVEAGLAQWQRDPTLSDRLKLRAQQFTWRATALTYLEAYRSLC